MPGIELRNGTLAVERDPNRLDGLAVGSSAILDQFDVEHVYVAGYVSVLAGRARSTEAVEDAYERLECA